MTLDGTGLLSYEQAKALAANAATVLQPRLPISTKELFAGRWDELTTLADAVRQPGLHVAIYGERGVGKTSLANVVRPTIRALENTGKADPSLLVDRIVIKANANSGDQFSTIWNKMFTDITWRDNRPAVGLVPYSRNRKSLAEAFGLPGILQIDDVRRTLASLPGSVFIIDEFDRAAQNTSRDFTDLLKALSDFAVDCTIILVGVSDTIDQLVLDHASISRGVIQIQLHRMKPEELQIILQNAENSLGVQFSREAKNLIVHLSQGLPHYTHLIGLHTVRRAALGRYTINISTQDVFGALKEAVKQAEQTVTEKHSKAIHSAHKDALFRHVLLACALAAATSHDALGYFNPATLVGPLQSILDRSVEIATFNNHLAEFCQPKRGSVLERTGQSRAYRYRFHDPLLVPYIFMDALNAGMITDETLALLGAEF
jgi:Cdc6-like AAA superfamily ATPase